MTEPELGGWVPAVDLIPADDDLRSEWAPRAGSRRRGKAAAQPRLRERSERDGDRFGTGEPEPGNLRTGDAGPTANDAVGSAPRADADPAVDANPVAGSVSAADASPAAAGEPDPAGDPVPAAGEDKPASAEDPDAAEQDALAAGEEVPDAGSGPVGVRAHRINGRWGRFAELWVPESMREARVDPGRRGMLVLVLVAAVAAVVAAVGVWRDRPEPRPVETAVVSAASGTMAATVLPTLSEAAASPAAITSPPVVGAAGSALPSVPPAVTEILVSVTGLVAHPGVVRLPPEARVADAIAAAGGTQPGANLTGMNLAAKLADGDSVVVTESGTAAAGPGSSGSPGSAGGSSAGSTGPAGGPVNLNTADEAALDTLPGVGPVMAQNILAWREANGKFATVEQLQEISGIGPSRYAQLAPLVTVG